MAIDKTHKHAIISAMVEKQINPKLPKASRIQNDALQRILADSCDTSLQNLTEQLASNEDVPLWIKEAVTFEIAHRRALQSKTVNEAPGWFKHTDTEALALMDLHLAPETELYPFGHDIIHWYSSQDNDEPEQRECFTVVGKGMHYVSEGQYHLLEAINQTNVLDDAFDRWVTQFPEIAREDADKVGHWLQEWITQGVLVR